MSEKDDRDTSESNLSRRRVLNGAAWSAPVIAFAVGTPLAAASPKAKLRFNTAGASWVYTAGKITGITLRIQVENVWVTGGGDARSVTVTVGFPAGIVAPGFTPVATGNGWNYGSSSGSSFTFTYSPMVGIGNNTGTTNPYFPVLSAPSGMPLLFTAKAENAQAVTAPWTM